MKLSMMKINFVAFFLVVLLCAFTHSQYINTQQQVESTTVGLNTIVSVNHTANTNKYYQTVVPNPQEDEILLITVASDIQSYIGIFVITSNSPNFVNGTWPDWSAYTQECFYASIDTCAIKMPSVSSLPDGQTNLTVYITVTIGNQDCTYNLQVSLETIYPISVGKKYGVTFNKIQSAMLQLNGSNFFTSTGQQVQQVVITCSYVSYRDIGHFMVLAQEGQIPNPGQYDVVRSRSLNAMTQILQLDPISANSSYYILLEGQNATKFNFTVKAIESLTNPDLKVNQTVSYLTDKPLTYSYHNMFASSANSTVLPLYLDLYAYRGYGKFFVDYCNNLHNFTFENTGGQSGQVQIPPQMRQECYAQVTSQGGLLIENLAVSVTDIIYEFGYSIGLFEGTFSFFLFPNMKQIGIVQSGNKQTYDVAAYGQSTNLTLVSQALVGNLSIVINQCQQNQYKNGTKYTTCTQITNISLNEANPINKVTFVCQNKSFCQVQVSQPQAVNYSKYSLTLTFTDESMMELLPNKPQFDIVQMNQYVHYYINVTSLRSDPQYQFSNATIINIRNSLVNGETVLLTSTNVQKPTFKDLFKQTSDVSYGFQGSATYLVNSTYPDYIYIGILGDTQSIYHIQFTLNTSANIPAAYLSMIDDAQNDYVITSSNPYVLTKYVSHIIPYSITFDPVPSCIKYGNKLPITSPCVSPNQMPNVFHQSVLYFNITQTLPTPGAVFKFSVYANSGSYLLSQDRPILIGCQKQCYQLITVVLSQSSATILHSGDGRLIQLPDTTNNSASNGPLNLKCPTSNCTFQLNATMKYGGQMQVAFQSSLASQIEWRTKPMTLPAQNQYKYYFMRLLSYSDFNSFIFYSQAADFTVYYNIMSLNQSYTNTLDFSYPNSTSFMQVSYGDPLQEIHIVDINDDLIQQYKCRERNIICIVTLSVTLNSSVEYSQQYLYQGLGYYSANTYQYSISTTYPILKLKQSYSLSYFTHVINFESQQTFFPHTIHIQPLSNCRPQVQTQATGYIKNFYTDVTLPRVMPGQKRINYRVLSNSVCMFNTALTTLPYELLFPNIQYNVRVQKNNTQFVGVYQHAQYQNSFTISLKQAALSIIIGKPTYTSNDEGQVTLNLPSMLNGSNIGYVVNSSTLTIKNAEFGQYIILVNFPSKSALQPIIVNTQSYPTILLHNQIHTYVFDPTDNSISSQSSPSFQYEYHSTNNFYIFAQVNRLSVQLTVRDAQNWGDGGEILTTIITNSSDPWVLVKAKPGSNSTASQILTNYKIQCDFIGTPEPGYKATFKIHIEDQGVIGLTQVYHGVSIYDSFVHDSAMNCYKFHAPMILGQDQMTIDLNFMSKEGQTYNNNKIVTGMASLVQKPTQSLSLKQSQISPSTYRLNLDYFTNSIYKICYTLSSLDMVGVQYSIIVNVPSMPMIYDNEYAETGKIYGDQYGMFEYINNQYDNDQDNIQGKPVTFTVTNCLSDNSTVLASSSYSDMQTGKMTQIANSWASAGIETVLINIPHGYYYFGVKSLHPDKYQLFRVNAQPSILIDQKPTIMQEQYYINWSIRGKIYTSEANSQQYVNIQVPTIAKSASANNTLTPSKIIYSLYLINLKTNQSKTIPYKFSIDAYTRCPALYQRANGTQLKPIQIISLANPINNNASYNAEAITFKLNINDFVPDTNISIIAQVFINDAYGNTNVLEYFYGDGQIKVCSGDDCGTPVFSILKWVIIIVFVFSTIGLVSAFIRFYWRRRGRSVNFEMAQYPSNASQSRRPTQPEPRVVVDTTNTSNTSNTTSNRRPLNGGAGYGEFVDQV